MPKKTKKEKLLALYHKKIRLLENKQVKTPASISPTPTFNHEIKPVITEPPHQYFFSDLKKSLLLIVFILGLEVSLYFARLIK